MKDLRARQVLGGFIPSCGVGSGFKREGLERLAACQCAVSLRCADVAVGRPYPRAVGLAQVAQSGPLRYAFFASLGLQAFHMVIRASCSPRIYGWRFATGVALRAIWGNWINGL